MKFNLGRETFKLDNRDDMNFLIRSRDKIKNSPKLSIKNPSELTPAIFEHTAQIRSAECNIRCSTFVRRRLDAEKWNWHLEQSLMVQHFSRPTGW